MTALSPTGTARARFLGETSTPAEPGTTDPDRSDLAYLGWEVARCARGLEPGEARALAGLVAATLAAMQDGSTRLPVDARLEGVLRAAGAGEHAVTIRSLVARARLGAVEDPVCAVIGETGRRVPLVLDGDWLYAERMHRLEERLCERVRARAGAAPAETRAATKALKGVAGGPPPLTDEQRSAVRAALTAPLALVTGGPGTGKTTLVVALLRALAWTGLPIESVGLAAPTGKAARRLQLAIAAGLASAPGDMAEAALRAAAPPAQTLHRLLGWSPSRGRFLRHEGDPLPHRVVIVDEASMIDLAMMDRVLRALRPEARLVLLGDADQLPSVEAGTVFRDLCAVLGAARLTVNLRVARDPVAGRIVGAAESVNAGTLGPGFEQAVTRRDAVDDVRFEGVEHLAQPWARVGDGLLGRWWNERVASLDDFARRCSRAYRAVGGEIAGDDAAELRILLEHHGRSRVLCATRSTGGETSARELNQRLLARFRGARTRATRWRALDLQPGAPVTIDHNDYERRLYNGDQGLVVRVDDPTRAGPTLAVAFPRGDGFEAIPLDTLADLSPAFAMTVHKAQGSEFDAVALVLPDTDVPWMTRELVYTAVTRARRSVLLVGDRDLLGRAVSRRVERYGGVAERLEKTKG